MSLLAVSRRFLLFLPLAAMVLALTACSNGPTHAAVEQKYSKCEKSSNLEGGIYGKGPFKRFGPEKAACSKAEWVEIDKAEFKRLATAWHGVDWSKEIPFWAL
jgi:hypothetical protein